MIEIVFAACLIGEPQKCRTMEITTDARTPMQCLMYAQPLMAQWASKHPNALVSRFRCARDSTAT